MTYSIPYRIPEEGTERAVDWNVDFPGEWSRSDKDFGEVRWYRTRGLDTPAYEALIEHFGLVNCQSDLPLERVTTMSWEELGALRRKFEKNGNLPRLEMRTCNSSGEEYVP